MSLVYNVMTLCLSVLYPTTIKYNTASLIFLSAKNPNVQHFPHEVSLRQRLLNRYLS